ncbi:MAG: hypothetical protein VXX55_08325 [Planctomycetota bacterium]|nr:hypothetical protein [Pirellulaceae bacterium]MEC7978056.1 hypothetical protein [Planctomycetota bacterium]MDP7376974.1 hypothetical protein [Pirellulaceae bacterium]MEC8162072.1 hypothetical protein [Planctomycetota bacterium]MEC8411410.1 hypothetical protein [Planctomycetota bacterium]
MRSAITVALSLYAILSFAGIATATEGELQAAQKIALETGRPLLVVAGTDT